MTRLLIVAQLIGLLGSLAISSASAQEMKRDILGVYLEMTRDEANARLREIGTFEREERKQQEVWQVRDPSFSHVIIGMTKEGKLRYVTAVARKDAEAKRLPYTAIGDVSQARQAGDAAINNYRFEWTLPAAQNQPATLVTALGRDPEFLSTYSLKRTGAAEPAEGED